MQLLRNETDARGVADDLNEWKKTSSVTYCLIPHGHPLRPGLLRCRAAHGHCRSALLSPTASLRSCSVPPCSLPRFRRSQVLLPLLPLWLLIIFLKLFSIPAPQSVDQEQHLSSPASPQTSLVSLCSRVPSFLCSVIFSLTVSLAALGLHAPCGWELFSCGLQKGLPWLGLLR